MCIMLQAILTFSVKADIQTNIDSITISIIKYLESFDQIKLPIGKYRSRF